MNRIIKVFIANTILFFVSFLAVQYLAFGSFTFSSLQQAFFFIAITSIFFLLIRPLVELVLKPVMALTFGVLGYFVVFIALYFVDSFLPGVSVTFNALFVVSLIFWLGNSIIR